MTQQPFSELHVNELRDRYATLDAQLSRLLNKRSRTEGEDQKLASLDAECEQLADLIQSRERGKPQTGPMKPMPDNSISVGTEANTYRPDGQNSYFRDLALAQLRGDFDARDRIQRHKQEVEATQPEFRDLNRTDTSGGEWVAPLWLLDSYAPALRAGRTTANLVSNRELPKGTDSINIPKISTGGSVDSQPADNANVSETDPVSSTLTGPVRTIAGQVDLALQLLEQSSVSAGVDAIIFEDLLAAYNAKVDLQVLNGLGTSGTLTGILQTSGIVSTSYTDGTPTAAELFAGGAMLQAKSQIERQRYANAEAIVMHPRRWNWLMAAVDSSNRPYVLPAGQGPNNALAVSTAVNAEGLVGNYAGLPIYTDPNVPTTLTAGVGSSGTEDLILIGRFSDAILFEGPVRTRLLAEPLSGTLTVRAQLYRYVSFIVRYPVAFGTVSGTGLASVSGF